MRALEAELRLERNKLHAKRCTVENKRLSDVMTVTSEGELRPRYDWRDFKETQSLARMSYTQYEQYCVAQYKEPSLEEWLRLNNMEDLLVCESR